MRSTLPSWLAILLAIGWSGTPSADAQPPVALPAQAVVSPAAHPTKGSFLVARPGMADPRFRRAVILLVAHGEGDGSVGLTVNRSTGVRVGAAIESLRRQAIGQDPLYFGGPVQVDTVLYLVRRKKGPEKGTPVVPDVHFGSDRDVLHDLANDGLQHDAMRLYAGYAGWGNGQLHAEIERGDWQVVPATAALVFDRRPDSLWRRLTNKANPRRAPEPPEAPQAPPGQKWVLDDHGPPPHSINRAQPESWQLLARGPQPRD